MAIAISFTLKGQELSSIRNVLEGIAARHEGEELIHGFMPRELVIEKGFSTELVDMLDELFPVQHIFFGRREEMVKYANSVKAFAIFVGEIKEGVAEEYDLYLNKAPKCNILEFDVI